MSEQQYQPGAHGAEPFIGRVERDAFFLIATGKPEIPDERGRDCPQCGHRAWADSRFCWHCRWDFDKAALARFHPRKLLMLSAALNLVQVFLLLLLILR